jgi:flagellar M-ring protein FliF
MVVMGLLGFVVLLMVVRPLVRRVLAPEERTLAALPPGAAPVEGAAADTTAAAKGGERAKAEPSQTAKMIDIAQVQGQVHAQSVQKVGDLADRNPGEAVSIIRQWLNDSAAA